MRIDILMLPAYLCRQSSHAFSFYYFHDDIFIVSLGCFFTWQGSRCALSAYSSRCFSPLGASRRHARLRCHGRAAWHAACRISRRGFLGALPPPLLPLLAIYGHHVRPHAPHIVAAGSRYQPPVGPIYFYFGHVFPTTFLSNTPFLWCLTYSLSCGYFGLISWKELMISIDDTGFFCHFIISSHSIVSTARHWLGAFILPSLS